jgi:hypothetical protein
LFPGLRDIGDLSQPASDFPEEYASLCIRLGMTEQIKRRYIIVKQPGKIPDKKRPIQSHAGAFDMLRELRGLYPDALLLLCEITWDDDLWVSDGDEVLHLQEILGVISTGKKRDKTS